MRRFESHRGFTLVELMISTALGAIIMTAVLSGFIFMGRNLSRLASYQALENESRKTLAYLRQDFGLARAVKTGTTPTATTVTLALPSGDVVYTYDSATHSLRRQATFGVSPTLTFLQNSQCNCTSFTFSYYTTTDAAPTDQPTSSVSVPYSIKQIEVGFTLESPTSWSAMTRTRFESASSRFLIRNRSSTDGT